jgi:hypothetical protein
MVVAIPPKYTITDMIGKLKANRRATSEMDFPGSKSVLEREYTEPSDTGLPMGSYI